MSKNKTEKERNTCAKCAECNFYSENEKCCFKEGGKLFNVKPLDGDLTEVIHDCTEFDEIRYMLTPKGILSWSLSEAGINISNAKLDEIWENFATTMEKCGYIKHDDEDEEQS